MIGKDVLALNGSNDKNFVSSRNTGKHFKSITAEDDNLMASTKIASGKMKSNETKNVKNVS